MGRLTTHVLDTALGKPARGLRIDLWRSEETPVLISFHVTNSDGRVDGPILDG
ncbi:MAG: hydroxyisourate hydrolase, partial [Pseudomonadota bacterium]